MGLAALGAAALLAYVVCGLVYRLCLSPLAHIPGPRLAAATHWVEFYYDVVRRGQYVFKIGEWHAEYGPIVRINPDEVHILDADFLASTVFTTSTARRREKGPVSTRVFGISHAAIATVDHDLHRFRRGAISRSFSKDSVRRVESIIRATRERMFARMQAYERSGQPMTISLLYSAFTADVITEYAFAKSINYLDLPDLNKKFFDMMVSVHEMGALARQYRWLLPAMNALPNWLVVWLEPGMHEFFVFQAEMRGRIREVKFKAGFYEKLAHETVFHEILASDLPASEKTVERLWGEAQTVSIAGTETTAWTLSVITYHLLSNPEVLKKLRAELRRTPETACWRELEQLPYLTAVIQEGLRMSHGVTSRLQRACPDEVISYDNGKQAFNLPAGTPISTSGPLYHLDPSIFPQPHRFRPERWLEEGRRLDKYLWSFGKGSRQCLGMNLAYAELYLCLSGVFRRYGSSGDNGGRAMELVETSVEDVELKYDLFVPFPKTDSEGVRVVLRID